MTNDGVNPAEQRDRVVAEILDAHKHLVVIAYMLRQMDNFDNAQHLSSAALHCRAAYNDLLQGEEPPL
jgi:hypothetical protein